MGKTKTTGDRLRAARKKAGLSQAKLGKKIGCRDGMISRWEMDHHAPSLKHLIDLSHVLKVSMNYLMTGS